ncbi:long-chain-fatty-acid--CoA ligase 1-like [Gigantopelta aegis]|uniref:long-chain-fatty-acid--CoA ligase 1-like n=1 Tax=Gigantopelta aegis TaxID=1735272 RepID=UPI001B887A23|nr:long-chain-fatty-acid--CoA ligase 1-like [Gigantopelta aegis]
MSEFVSSTELLLQTYLGEAWWYTVSGVVAGLMCASWFFLGPGPEPFRCPVDIHKQSIDTGDGVRVSPLMLDLKDGKPIEYLYEDAKTLHEVFMRGLRIARNGKCLGTKIGNGYQWLTYQQVHQVDFFFNYL